MRIALGIEYNGHALHGWQAQGDLPTVALYLQQALQQIAAEPIHVYCAGRTDAGVHALQQVVHFDTTVTRSLRAWTVGVNTHLPSGISVQWAREVDDHFHARFSARSRTYRYVIYNHTIKPALLHARVAWFYKSLNEKWMRQASKHLLGENDFSSFRSSQCDSHTPMRCVKKISIKRHEHFIVMEIQANAFLHHMVRNIVGVLVKIGEGIEKPAWAKTVLLAKDRRVAAETAPASGLYLIDVDYPKHYAFPKNRSTIIGF